MDDKFFLSVIDRFNSSAVAELEFSDGNTRLLLRKESALKHGSSVSANVEADQSQPVHHGMSKGAADVLHAAGNKRALTDGEKIISPIVATFYSTPGPDAPPFVKNGTKVKAGQTLCILEAMKMMNQLEAEYDCEIIEVHASSGELVEYGQELFTVKRN